MMRMTHPIQPVKVTASKVSKIVEVEMRPGVRAQRGKGADDWLCAWCHNRVASDKDRHAADGRDEFTFRNPDGVRFEILTFSRTLACRQAGEPTLEHSWFPGHAWSYCVCGRCHSHLGWYYDGPSTFAGLIRERIVPAPLVFN
jgi:hypothetical protein